MSKIDFVITITIVFIIGWLSATIVSSYDIDLFPEPIGEGKMLTEPFLGFIGLTAKEVPSPTDRIDETQIAVYKDKVTFFVDDPTWVGFYDTNSMDPLLDKESDAIEIMPESPLDINVGDVVSYVSNDGNSIVHRVVDIGEDSDGFYYLLKGDNNPVRDPEKVRFYQITGVVVAVFY